MRNYYGSKVALLFGVNLGFYLQNLLFLPLFSRALGLEMYGVWAQISAALSLLAPIVLSLHGAFTRFSAGEDDRGQVARNYYSILLFTVVGGLVLALLLYCSSGHLARHFIRTERGAVGLIEVSCLLLLAQVLSRYCLTYFATFQRTRLYSLFRLLLPSVTICSAVATLVLGFGLAEVIVVFAVVHLLIFGAGQYLITRELGFQPPDLGLLRPILLFSLPLVPVAMMIWVTGLCDRYLIGYFLPVLEVGKYSAAYTVGMIVMFFYAPFRAFLFPRGTELWERGDEFTLKKLLNYSNKFPLLLSIPAVFGSMSLYEPILRIMTGKQYEVSVFLIPIIAMGYIFHYVGTAYSVVFQFEKKTIYQAYSYGIGAIANVAGNILLLPLLGIIGAGVATMVTFLLMMIYFIHKSRKFYDIELEWNFVWKAVVAACAMFGVLHLLEPILIKLGDVLHVLGASSVGSGVYFLGIWALGVINKEEIAYVKRLLESALR